MLEKRKLKLLTTAAYSANKLIGRESRVAALSWSVESLRICESNSS